MLFHGQGIQTLDSTQGAMMKSESSRMIGQIEHGLWEFDSSRESEVMERAARIGDKADAEAFRSWMFSEFPENR